MPDFKSPLFCKAITVFLCVFLVFSVHYVFPWSSQTGQTEVDALTNQFNNAKDAYFAEDYENAKVILENLEAALAEKEGLDTLKGGTYLLLGATYEKLGYKILAMKYYCLAKDTLGEGKTIEGLELQKLRYYAVTCQTPSGIAVFVLLGQYNEAYGAYFAEDYENAKVILENLVAEIETLRGWESFKGETYLLLGATYEKLKYKELSIKYFCMAKDILGVGKTIEGLELRKLKYYRVKCKGVAAGVVVVPRKRGGGFGKFIGALLGLAILGGLVWYLFINKNSPLKKKTEEAYVYRSSCFSTHWEFNIYSVWQGSIGDINFTPENTAPNPNENNNWDNSVTYTLAKSGGGTLKSISLKMSLTTSGGDGITRVDTIWVDNDQKLNVTNTYTQPCSNRTVEHEYEDFYTRSSLGSFTVRHKINLTDTFGRTVRYVKIISHGKTTKTNNKNKK